MSLVGALTKALKAGETAKKTAPFYSAVDEALANIARPKGTGAEFLTELSKQPGVKKAELADRKLEQAFKAKGKITKEEAQQILKENPPPQIKERVIDDTQRLDEEELKDIIAHEMFGKPYDQVYNQRERSRVFDEAQRRMDTENGTRYGDYKTPGGENYREILLKLPEAFNSKEMSRMLKLEADLRRGELPTNEMQELVALKSKRQNSPKAYQSSHWSDDPNVLAHMRVQDRTGPNGEKILHVEEIQSDWHQAGRKKGYESDELGPKVSDEEYKLGVELQNRQRRGEPLSQDEIASLNDIMGRHTRSYSGGKVPDAPFKKNWHELAMKRLLNYAADNGYDSIAITPGAEQAKRYDLSKQVDELLYKQNPDGTYKLSAQARGTGNMIGEAIPAEKLEDYVGKDVAQKIIDNRGTERNLGGSGSVSQPKDVWGSLSGEGLQVGGEGMKGFYDQILPSYLNTFGKPYGAQVQQLQVPVKHELQGLRNMGGYPEEPPLTMHNFPITPEMREAIKQKGLPLYQQVGIPTAGAGAASQMPEPEEGLAGGGIVNSLAKTEALAKLAKLREQMAPRAEAVKNLIAKDANAYLRDVVPNSLTNPEIEAEIARMAAKTPQIIKPSGLTELKKIVEQQKGGYGARRVERAADEIPNLEKMYQQEALQQAFTGDNAKALMTMNPADFEKYAIPLEKRVRMGPKAKELALRGEIDKYTVPTDELVKYLANLDDGFQHLPYLNIFKDELGLPVRPNIVGHEGRHRNRALAERGETSGLVQLNPSGDLREGMPRRSQEEFIEALKQELKSTNKLVYPESDRSNIRPPIILPDVYAKGGSVKRQVKKADGGAINYNTAPDMSDGGRIIQGAPFKHGGKVNITTNRDAMFMELSNKKLKRK